jgi:hypothetical protein
VLEHAAASASAEAYRQLAGLLETR